MLTEQRQGLRSASSSLSGLLHPPWCIINPRSSIFRAACPSSHQSEVAHPAFCHKPQTSDAIQFATFRETKPSLLLFGPRRSACRHHMSVRFLDPMRLSHRTEGSGIVTPTAERTRWVGPVQPDPLGLRQLHANHAILDTEWPRNLSSLSDTISSLHALVFTPVSRSSREFSRQTGVQSLPKLLELGL